MSQQLYQNTFAPLIENQELTLDNIIKGLFLGFIRFSDLPTEIRKIVDEEMQNRTNPPVNLEPVQEGGPGSGRKPEFKRPAKPTNLATGKSHNIPTYIDVALKAYKTGKKLSSEDFEKLNYTEAFSQYSEEQHPRNPDGTWKDKGAADKPLSVKEPSLMPEEPKKKSIFDKLKKKQEPQEKPAFEGAEFEPIIKSNAPTEEHMTTAEQVLSFYPEVFGTQREFLVHQAWAADQLRAVHEPVAKALKQSLEQTFPGTEVQYRIKKRYNMLEKMGRKPERYHTVQDLTDISGVKAIPQTNREAKAIMEHLKNTTDLVETENYVESPKEGYRAIQLLVKDRNTGLLTEVQIKTPRQDRWALWDHDFEYKPRNQKLQNIIEQHREDVHGYAMQMSAYYFSLDNGETNVQVPDCPEIVRRLLECME